MRQSILSLLLFLLSFSVLSQSFSQEKIDQIIAFNKLYGYVKYFHPSDEAAELDWDAFAIYGVKRILESEETDFKTVLEELFLPVAPSMLLYSSGRNQEIDFNSFLPQNPSNLDTIHWQHLGNGNFNNANIYKSLRTNRKRRFYPVNYYKEELLIEIYNNNSIKAGDYQLKFKLKNNSDDAYYRVNIESCWKSSNNELRCEELGNINTQKWLNFTDNFKIPEQVTSVYLKIKTRGAGETLLDDVFFLNPEENDPLNKIDFESISDTDINIINLSKQDKYFKHRLIKDEIANNTFLSLYPHDIFKDDSLLFEPSLKYTDIMEGDISDSLKFKLPLVLLGNSTNTFPITDSDQLSVLEKSVSDIYSSSDLSPKNLAFRISNVIILWNTIQHFYPYFKDFSIDWYGVLETALTKSFKDKDQYDHLRTLESMLSNIKDSHVFVNNPDDKRNYHLPVFFRYIENSVIVTDTFDDKIDICVGDQIIALNGVPIDKLLYQYKEFVSSGVESVLNQRALNKIFSFFNNEKIILETKDIKGKIKGIKLRASLSNYKFINSISQSDKILAHGKINEKAYYLNLTSLTFFEFQRLLPELEKADNLIMDMRGHPVETAENFRKIIGYFIDYEINTKWMYIPEISKPYELNSFHELGWSVTKMLPNLKNKNIYYLIDGNAQSYGESITGYFRTVESAIFVGSPTAGANGDVSINSLLGGFYYRFTGMKVLKHDGSRLHGIGFLPDVEVRPTIKGIIEGRDEVLEKAIELAKRNN